MHLFKQFAVRDAEAASRAIPIVDFGPYFAGEPGALERLGAELRHACENVGFLYAANHGVPQDLIDRAFDASRRFHAQPLEDKLKRARGRMHCDFAFFVGGTHENVKDLPELEMLPGAA